MTLLPGFWSPLLVYPSGCQRKQHSDIIKEGLGLKTESSIFGDTSRNIEYDWVGMSVPTLTPNPRGRALLHGRLVRELPLRAVNLDPSSPNINMLFLLSILHFCYWNSLKPTLTRANALLLASLLVNGTCFLIMLKPHHRFPRSKGTI